MIKKDIIQAVKKYLIVVLFFVTGCASSLPLQEILQGEYYLKRGHNSGAYGVSYRFDDHTFKEKGSGHMGASHKARGTYHISRDTLILDYEPFKDPDPSTYRFLSKKKTPHAASDSVLLKVVSRNQRTLPKAGLTIIATRDSAGNSLKGFVPDSLGYIPKIAIDNNIHDFRITHLSRKAVTIPADTLRGYDSKINIALSDTKKQYRDYEEEYNGMKKFIIKERDKNRIVLQLLAKDTNRDRTVLVRKGTE